MRLPMGLSNAPDIFQEKMAGLTEHLEFVKAYLDDLLCITKGSFEDHVSKLQQSLTLISNAGLRVNVKNPPLVWPK